MRNRYELMKLLLVVDSFWGGAGNVMQILAGELSRRGHSCTLLLLNGSVTAPKHDLTGVEVREYPLVQNEPAHTPIGRLLRYRKAVKRLINEIKPQAILSFLTEYNDLTAWSVGGKYPLVISERNNPFHDQLKPQWVLLRKLFYHRADRVVIQCSQFAEYFNDSLQPKLRVIPNPILAPTQSHQPREDRKIRLVSLGRLHPQKNFPWMIEAVCRIHAQNPACTLTIYGTGDEEDKLRAQIEQNHAQSFITLAGKTSTPHEVMAHSDIFLMTSDYEGFPNALSEAMAVGLPTVTRLCHEGLRDLVQDGINGYLTPASDMDCFINCVLQLAQDVKLRLTIGGAATEVSKRFSVAQIVDQWEKVLTEAIQNHITENE